MAFTTETKTKLPWSTVTYQNPHRDQKMSLPKTTESRGAEPKSERKHPSWGLEKQESPPTPEKRKLYGVDRGEHPGVGIRASTCKGKVGAHAD